MKKSMAIFTCLFALNLAACSSGNDSKKDGDKAPPKKTVFDSYVKDVKKAKQVQGKLDAANQAENSQLQRAESGNTTSQPDAAQPPTN